MSAEIQRLPNGRHVVALVGDPGPLPDEQESQLPRAGVVGDGAGLLLARKAWWSREIALRYERIFAAESFEELRAACLMGIVAIDQWMALDESA